MVWWAVFIAVGVATGRWWSLAVPGLGAPLLTAGYYYEWWGGENPFEVPLVYPLVWATSVALLCTAIGIVLRKGVDMGVRRLRPRSLPG